MRSFSYSIPICAALALTSCFGNDDPKPPHIPPLTVDALEVIETVIDGRPHLQGKFTIRNAKAGESSLQDAGEGGACVLAQIQRFDGGCEKHEDCNINVSRPGQIEPTTWTGYCLSNKLSGDLAGKRCWVKHPNPNFCRRNVRTGFHYTPPADPAEVHALVAQRPNLTQEVRWMVYGCLNGPYTGTRAPCARGTTGPFIDDQGPVRSIPEPRPFGSPPR